MGVPAFYRWLIKRYPNVVVNAVQDHEDMEFDNLYLDMNGIIHPCFHPDDHLFPPCTFQEVFEKIFEYIDMLFNIVRPSQLLYLAIDGVAPRAKMNQQRARRYQNAKDYEIAEKEEERLRMEYELEGKLMLPKRESETWDSNVITPGTEFMHRLSKELEGFIRTRINSDPGWKEIKVILSNANVPGEGEHKIMSFIRHQRTLPTYNPNTRHCLYGLDADLIMLALATHEVHFSVLRENVLEQEQKPRSESTSEITITQHENISKKSRGWFKQYPPKQEQDNAPSPGDAVKRRSPLVKKPFQFLHVWLLREYLEAEMKAAIPPQIFNCERVVDDFIFICFFVGNDFLPHMPSLDIREGAIDLLLHVYKTEFGSLGDYIVDMSRVEDKKAGYIKLSRVERFILKVGSYEEDIFKKRQAIQDRRVMRMQEEYERNRDENEDGSFPEMQRNLQFNNSVSNMKATLFDEERATQILQNTKELKERLKDFARKESDTFKDGFFGTDKLNINFSYAINNRVRFGSVGWRERYYKEKFSAETPEKMEATRKSIVEKYTEGLCWVLKYYFSGVASWTWFYPYHYGPFASDLKGMAQIKVKFQKGSPFKPFDQLLGVLPSRSAHALPEAYRSLMSDENSEIIDFYPTDFKVDVDGKRFKWQGVCKLPFIDEQRLLSVTRTLEKELKEEEAIRNARSRDQLFVRSPIKQCLQIQKDTFRPILSQEFEGFMGVTLDYSNASVFEYFQDQETLCVYYDLPTQIQFVPRLLEGVNVPVKTISESDIEESQLWHEYQGNRPNNSCRVQYQGTPRKMYNSPSTSHNTTPPVCKAAGIGFLGRGKNLITTTQPSNNRVGICAEGIQNLRVSDTNRGGFEPYGRAPQHIKDNFWSSRNLESNAQYHRYNAAATSTQGRERAPQQVNNNVWSRRTMDSNVHDYRYYDSSTSTQGRGRGQYDSATSTQDRGRGQYVNNVNDAGMCWKPNKPNTNYGDERYGDRW